MPLQWYSKKSWYGPIWKMVYLCGP